MKTVQKLDKQKIEKTIDNFVLYWNKNDVDSWGTLFTDDVDYINRNGGWWKNNKDNIAGHKRIHKMLKEMDQPKTFSLKIGKIECIKPDVAVVQALSEWPGFKSFNFRRNSEILKGIITFVFIKKEEKWLIKTLHTTLNNDDELKEKGLTFVRNTMNISALCISCGTLYPKNYSSNDCQICTEERQYVPEGGQRWTTMKALSLSHKNKISKLTDRLFDIVIEPRFAIGQRAFLVLSDKGNVLWDCVPLLDKQTIEFINSKGGLKAIAFSHPHYYSNMGDWANTFDCPIYIHNFDKQYIVNKNNHINLWKGEELALWDDIKLVNIGGHFKGSSIMIISDLSSKGAMLCGDTMYLSPSKKHFAIMYSYPNRLPLSISEIKRIKQRLKSLEFDSVFGFFSYQNLFSGAKEVLDESLKRYLS